MKKLILPSISILICATFTVSDANVEPNNLAHEYEVYFEWKKVEYEFPNETIKETLIKERKLIQKNVIINGVKIYKNRMFLTTSRYLEGGVPVTLSVVPYNRNLMDMIFRWKLSPILKPFPSYEMQEEGNCEAFQLVESMEVDQFGRLWVVDSGRTNILTPQPKNLCPAKLVVFDLNNNDKILFNYTFPADVVSPTVNAIKDISIACTSKDDCWVYISDLFGFQLIIYDHKNKRSWSAFHPTMNINKAGMNFTIKNEFVSAPFGITANVLAPKSSHFSTLYFTSISSKNVFKIETKILQNPKLRENNTLQASDVTDLGMKNGQSDGMAMDHNGILYYGVLPECAVYQTKLSDQMTNVGFTLRRAQNNRDISWLDALAFDGNGYLTVVTNQFHLFQKGTLNDKNVRYRILRFWTGSKAYNYS